MAHTLCEARYGTDVTHPSQGRRADLWVDLLSAAHSHLSVQGVICLAQGKGGGVFSRPGSDKSELKSLLYPLEAG